MAAGALSLLAGFALASKNRLADWLADWAT